MWHSEELPSPLSWPAAIARPSEGQVTLQKGRELLQAFLEYASIALLADHQVQRGSYEGRLEATMRFAMTREMGFREWASVFRDLAATPRGQQLLGIDIHARAAEGSPIDRACQLMNVDPTLAALLDASHPEHVSPIPVGRVLVEVSQHLASIEQSTLKTHDLCYITGVRELSEDGHEVRFQLLVGTAFPETKVRRFWRAPPLVEGQLFFWDGNKSSVPVPAWLARFEPSTRTLYLYRGRSSDDEWTYGSRNPVAQPLHFRRASHDMPIFLSQSTTTSESNPLKDPTRATHVDFDEEVHPDTQMLRMEEVEETVRSLMKMKSPGPASGGELTATATLVLSILGSRSFMNYLELRPNTEAVIGRSEDKADFVIDHAKVSRRNSQITVQRDGRIYVSDMGSTNGTLLNGKPVDKRPVPVRALDLIQIGPVLLRVQPMEATDRRRTDLILSFVNKPDRDPLTGLLKPGQLQRYLGTTGDSLGDAPLTGVVVYIDRLSSIHAAKGEDQANEIFCCVARQIMSVMADPTLCVRVGYGECLAILRGASAGPNAGIDMANLFLDHIKLWPTTEQVSVTAGVVDAQAGESLQQWIQRSRELTLRGSTGEWRVLTATSQKTV